MHESTSVITGRTLYHKQSCRADNALWHIVYMYNKTWTLGDADLWQKMHYTLTDMLTIVEITTNRFSIHIILASRISWGYSNMFWHSHNRILWDNWLTVRSHWEPGIWVVGCDLLCVEPPLLLLWASVGPCLVNGEWLCQWDLIFDPHTAPLTVWQKICHRW